MRMYHLQSIKEEMNNAVLFLDDKMPLPDSLAYKDLKNEDYTIVATYQLIKLGGQDVLPECIEEG